MAKHEKTSEPGVYRRGPGQYEVKIRRKDVATSRTFDTFAEAVRFKTTTVGKIDGDDFVDKAREKRTKLSEVIDLYMTEESPKKKGVKQEINRLRAWKKEAIASYPIISVDITDIVEWRERMVRAGKAPSTVYNSLNLLSAVFKWARQHGFKVDNPCTGVARPKANDGRCVDLTDQDEAKLVAACEEGPPWLVWAVKIAMHTAMRQGEIRALKWKDVHDTHIHIPRSKSGSARDVPLTSAASACIRDMRDTLPRRLDGWVFGDPDASAEEGGFTTWHIQYHYRAATRRIGLAGKLTFHDLRHVGCTRLAPLHRDCFELAKTTGHKDPRMLMRYYNPSIVDRVAQIRARERALAMG
ncbi:site-specific integrase [Acetobacter farinalis]|uniref:Site-specific integrase n=1 Tax=Acetobacter farinalis TaxID=1260984 RepID=A0ABT3Q6T4_9PROT|nr:site-specific integrase [Acetobacter farinalis]MCX2560969.1 site-specific integrase [Acetobacter farinalis]NHO29781.1 tyrosine-type recombinase/integrase [Acetobacter farinalis]